MSVPDCDDCGHQEVWHTPEVGCTKCEEAGGFCHSMGYEDEPYTVSMHICQVPLVALTGDKYSCPDCEKRWVAEETEHPGVLWWSRDWDQEWIEFNYE